MMKVDNNPRKIQFFNPKAALTMPHVSSAWTQQHVLRRLDDATGKLEKLQSLRSSPALNSAIETLKTCHQNIEKTLHLNPVNDIEKTNLFSNR